MSEADQRAPLSPEEMSSAIAAALAFLLRRAGGSMSFHAEEIAFSGNIYVRCSDDGMVTFDAIEHACN